jgi:hypothetical protein
VRSAEEESELYFRTSRLDSTSALGEATRRPHWPSWVVEALLRDLRDTQHRIDRAFSVLAEAGAGDLLEAVLEAVDILGDEGTRRAR